MLRRTLYAIGDDMVAFDALLEAVGGDVSDPAAEAAVDAWAEDLAADEGRKLGSIMGYVSQLDMEAAQARAEAAKWGKRAQSREATAARLRAYVVAHLERTGDLRRVLPDGAKISVVANGGRLPVLPADGKAAIVADEIPDRFRRVRVEADAEAIRTALEAGEELPFARLGERGRHLRTY